MPGKLAFQSLKFVHELLVAPGLAGLTLERANLPLDFTDGVGHAQQVLLSVVELSQSLFFLRLEPCDSGCLLKHHPPVIRLAGDDLGDVALGHDAVTGPPHTGAHEKLLDILEPARNLVDKKLAGTVTENPARHRNLVIRQIDSRSLELIGINTTKCQRHLRHAKRLAIVGAVKNHIRHP